MFLYARFTMIDIFYSSIIFVKSKRCTEDEYVYGMT